MVVGSVRTDSARVVVGAAEQVGMAGFADAVLEGCEHPAELGVDVYPLTGMSAVVVRTGMDGQFPVELEIESNPDGEEVLVSLTVRFRDPC